MGENGFWVLARRPCEQDLTSKEKRTDLFVYRKKIYIALLIMEASDDEEKIDGLLEEANAEGCKAIFFPKIPFPFKSILEQDAAFRPNSNPIQKIRKIGGRTKKIPKTSAQLKLKLEDHE